MRTVPAGFWTLWASGGPYIGDDAAPHGRVTVEPGWFLTAQASAGSYTKQVHWFQRADNSQVEVEIPGVKSIDTDHSIDSVASTCSITFYNQKMKTNTGAHTNLEELGSPGYYTATRGASADSQARWGQVPNEWANVLVPNALLRTYQGFGGRGKTIADAVDDGNIILTGMWLIDKVRVSSNGTMSLECRDMAKLLIEQPIYPPLAPTTTDPATNYPHTIEWFRFYDVEQSIPVGSYGTAGPQGIVTGIERSSSSQGYWILGSDGGVFSVGNAVFHGSLGDTTEPAPSVSMAKTYTGNGYWLVGGDGAIYAFGDAQYLGGAAAYIAGTAVEIEAHSTGQGYWITSSTGGVYSYGASAFFGSGLSGNVVGMAARPQNDGYWLVNSIGVVQDYGGAQHYGQPYPTALAAPITGIEPTSTGLGYWLVGEDGGVFAYGDAGYHGSAAAIVLSEPMCDMVAAGDNSGYWLVAEDGGVFAYGVPFYGSLPGVLFYRYDGNYLDYTDIVKELLLWSGWYLYPHASPFVYGNMETTGAYAEEPLSVEIFDKKPVIDAINTIKEIVGYLFWIDEEGAARFESPNFFDIGNFFEDGSHTTFVPEIDELVTLTDYSTEGSDQVARSEIIITTDEPTAMLDDTRTARIVPPSVALCRGMSKPMMYGVPITVSFREQTLMAELFALHMKLQERFGSVSAVANPAIQINDQVRIFERQTSETYIHYVRGIHTTMDLDSGQYIMTITSHWLGDSSVWAVG